MDSGLMPDVQRRSRLSSAKREQACRLTRSDGFRPALPAS